MVIKKSQLAKRRFYRAVGAALIGLGTCIPTQTHANTVTLPPFSAGLPSWQTVILDPDVAPNAFTFKTWGDRAAVQVDSDNSMSLLATDVAVDLQETPFLCWWWRVAGSLKTADMRVKSGDDFAARVYVSVEVPDDQMGLGRRLQLGLARAIWGSALPDGAINYVWDNQQAIGHEQANAYTDLAQMIVLQTGDSLADQWVPQVRDVGQDIERLFGPGTQIKQVAVTTDTDNTGEQMRAGFADLRFTDDPAKCPIL